DSCIYLRPFISQHNSGRPSSRHHLPPFSRGHAKGKLAENSLSAIVEVAILTGEACANRQLDGYEKETARMKPSTIRQKIECSRTSKSANTTQVDSGAA